MKAKLSGKIRAFRQITQAAATDRTLLTEIDVAFSGKIESDKVSGKEIEAIVTIRLKPVFAETLRFGQGLHFDLSTDSTETETETDRIPTIARLGDE